MRSCAIHVHKHSVEAMLLQKCREVITVILSITPWLPTYMGQSLIRCNILEDFEVEEIMGSYCNAERKKVLYLIKWKGYLEESEWTEEPLQHFPRALVRSFHARHPWASMDDKLKQRARVG